MNVVVCVDVVVGAAGARVNKPRVPVTVVLLSVVVLVGLVSLFLAARAAFSQVAGPVQAVGAALLIEAGTVSEAIAFARSRNRLAGAGLVISFCVSATYNYTQAVSHNLAWNVVQLLAVALGPLSALVFIALSLGEELRLHGARVEEWREVEAHRLELRVKRKERREMKLALAEWSVVGQAIGGGEGVGRWPDKAAFLSDDGRPREMGAGQLAAVAGISERTARRWLAAARAQDEGKGGHYVGADGER